MQVEFYSIGILDAGFYRGALSLYALNDDQILITLDGPLILKFLDQVIQKTR